jgi:hypothetical protein
MRGLPWTFKGELSHVLFWRQTYLRTPSQRDALFGLKEDQLDQAMSYSSQS